MTVSFPAPRWWPRNKITTNKWTHFAQPLTPQLLVVFRKNRKASSDYVSILLKIKVKPNLFLLYSCTIIPVVLFWFPQFNAACLSAKRTANCACLLFLGYISFALVFFSPHLLFCISIKSNQAWSNSSRLNYSSISILVHHLGKTFLSHPTEENLVRITLECLYSYLCTQSDINTDSNLCN